MNSCHNHAQAVNGRNAVRTFGKPQGEIVVKAFFVGELVGFA
jgi:hypothetical protein